MYKSNVFKIGAKDREFPPVPIFLGVEWNGKSVQLAARKINENEIWIEVRPLLPPSVVLKEKDKVSGRLALVTGNGFNEFEGVIERVEACAITPSYNYLSLLIIKVKKLSKKALAEVDSYRSRYAGRTFFEKTDPYAVNG
jgi:hypothetical protein